jgi:hypothetical protein
MRVSGETKRACRQDRRSRAAARPIDIYPIDGLRLKSRETLIGMGKTT